MSEDIWKNIPEEDRRRIEGNWSYSYQLVAIDECEYWQPKLKERDELLELMYDELIRAKHHVLKGYCYTAIQMKELDNLITRYSNLKPKKP